jgi:hypothetical protein
VENDKRVLPRGRGVVAVQYTPWNNNGGDDGCTRKAKVRMYYQGNGDPVIDKTWDATNKQVNGKRRRDDSCSQLSLAPLIQGRSTNTS